MPAAAAAIDTAAVGDVVRQIIASLEGDLTPADIKLFQEVESLSRYIQEARREIASLETDEIRRTHIPSATDQLDAIVDSTEEATGQILDCAEVIEGVAAKVDAESAEKLTDAVTRIYEACNFQDLTGQRISKVVKALQHIEAKVEAIVRTFGHTAGDVPPPPKEIDPTDERHLLNGPAMPSEASKQAEIDALLASFD